VEVRGGFCGCGFWWGREGSLDGVGGPRWRRYRGRVAALRGSCESRKQGIRRVRRRRLYSFVEKEKGGEGFLFSLFFFYFPVNYTRDEKLGFLLKV
jgi:hypothetical protein